MCVTAIVIIDQDGQLEGNHSTRHAASDALARARIVFVYTHLLPAFFQGAPFQATRRPIVSYFLPLSLIFYHCLVFFTVLCVPMYSFSVYINVFFFVGGGGWQVLKWFETMFCDNVLSTLHAAHSSSMCSKDICVVKTYV